MNNTFNLHRFGRLFVKQTAENYKSYLMSLTVLTGVMILGGSFFIYMIGAPIDRGFQTAVFGVFILLAGAMFTSTIFAGYGDKKKAVAALTLPASHFEKFLVAWLYSLVIFAIVYALAFYLIAFFAINVKHFPQHPPELIDIFEWPVNAMFVLYAFSHSMVFFGALFFEKLHFIKTAFMFFISLAVLIIINRAMLGILVGKIVEVSVPFGNIRVQNRQQIFEIRLDHQQDYYMLTVMTVLTLVFWVAAYYRLKEKQV